MFVDHIKIHAKAGDGGNGCVSFRREKFVPKGGPDGGNGGRGGDVILRADPHVDNLADFFYQPIIKAKSGTHGRGKNMYGRAAQPTVARVPPGTLVYRVPKTIDSQTEPEEEQSKKKVDLASLELLADLTRPGEEFLLCKGGEGGKGNVHFKSSRNRAPREYTEGEPGEEGDFYLELRTIADAALVGYPNAGKSTLLTRISAAHPKVAPYPFTTLHPVIGVVEFPGYRRLTVADVPGLIEGAHRNVGLGHEFLRHVIRCKLLLFVVDTAGSEGRDPLEDLSRVRAELKLYDPQLARRPWMIIANKMDLPQAKENLRALKSRYRRRVIVPISAEQGIGLEELTRQLAFFADA
jgi:GTPase